MKQIIKFLGLVLLVVTQVSLSSALAAVTTTTTYNDGDILFSDDFENTSTNSMAFSGGTFPTVSAIGHNNITSTCMEVSVTTANAKSGKMATFTFPSTDASALSPSYIEISGWAKASNVVSVTSTTGSARASVKINNVGFALKFFLLPAQWEQFVMLVPIPLPPKPPATITVNTINLNLGLWEASGTVLFDDLQIKLVKKIPMDSNKNYAGAYQQYYTGHPINPVVSDASQADTYFRGMHHSDTFFRTQSPKEGLEVLGRKWNANIFRWMLECPAGNSNIDNQYTLSYDSGPVTITNPTTGSKTTYKYGTYWDILDDALARLDEALKYAQQYGLKVVVNLAGLSGGLFESKANQDKFVQVWQKIADRYKVGSQYSDAIYGYDLANEPFVNGGWQKWTGAAGVLVWDDLSEKTAQAINAIDNTKTIIIEPWLNGPAGFSFQVPINASKVVYSVHMYKPNVFTGQTSITGFDWPFTDPITKQYYDKTTLINMLNTVKTFQTTYNAHIYVGEFSATRWAGPTRPKTAAYKYIKDCVEIFEANKWDWTYFGFRSTGWSAEDDDNINTYNKGFFSSSFEGKPNSREQLLRMYFAKNQNPYTLSNASLPLSSLTINSIYNYTNFYAGYNDASSTSVKLKLSGVLSIDEVNNFTGYYVSNSNMLPSALAVWNSIPASNFFFDNTINHTLTSGNGLKTVYAWFKDTAGGVFGPVTDTINLNTSLTAKIKPTITITEPTTMDNYTTTQPYPNLRCIIVDDVALASFNQITIPPTYTINNGQSKNLFSAKNQTNSSDPEDPNEWYANPTLFPGTNVITVTGKDNDNNTATDTINITYNPILINIISPTSDVTYTTANSTLDIKGIASDKAGVINKVEWSNDGGLSYLPIAFTTVTGNTTWSVTGISLVSGNNDIGVKATDNAGNTATDSLSVTYNSSSVTAPTATTNQATNIAVDSATLNGLVNPNGSDTNVYFEYGTTSGNYSGQINANPNSISASSATTSVGANLSGLTSNTTYYYRVVAVNSAGTTNGNEMSFTTTAALDITSPSVPQNLTAAAVSSSRIDLSWSASTDNVGVAGYKVYRGASQIASVTSGTTYSDIGLSANTSYSYTVSAYDAAGKSSAQSSSVSATTLSAADTIAPIISNISSSGITYNSVTITWTTNENSDSQVEYGPTTSYGQTTALNAILVASHTVNLSGLSANTLYHYRVKSRDAAGNLATSVDYKFTTSTIGSGDIITINPQITYQTMIGWEAAADAALTNTNGVEPAKYKDELLDVVVNDIGINQIQLGIFPSGENSVDYWSQYQNSPQSQSDYDTWRANRQTTVNDDNDPNNINWNGFKFSKLDDEMDNMVVPLRQLLTAKGEQLHFNLRYVAYTAQSTGVSIGQKYDHDDPQEYAEYILAVFLHLKNKYGFVPDALTIINEPDNSAAREWVQQGARGTLIGRAIVAVGDKLKQNGFSPRILAPETMSIAKASSVDYFDNMVSISGVTQYLSEITYHRYVNSGNPDADLQAIANKAAQYGLDTGMHEYWNPANSYQILHKDIKIGKNSSWQQGTLGGLKSWASSLYGTTPLYTIDDTDPANPTLAITPMTKFTRQYYKFIRKGAIRIDATSNNTNFDPVAFVNTNGKYVVVVNANTGGTFSIKNLPAGNYGIKYTTLNQYDIDLTDQDISSGQTLTTNIPAAGVITIYGKTIQSTDNTKPNGSITISGTAAPINTVNVTLNLSATDNVGVTGYYVSESSTAPTATQTGWVSVTSTTNYLASISYTLSSGDGLKTLYGWYKDGSDNISNITSDSIRLDTSLPSINITIPTLNAIYNTTNSTISIGGIAVDSNSSGIQSLAWYSNRGGNGTVTGGANWTIGNISLLSGNNILTVTARDNAGNINNDTITVGYTQVTALVAITGSSLNVTYNTSTLSATVNAGGLQTTAYFEYGANASSYSSRTFNQTITGSNNTTIAVNVSGLSSNTTYYYRIVASNAVGNAYGSQKLFTTNPPSDAQLPTGSISINNGASYTNTTALTLSLSASDNRGVAGYYLSTSNITPESSAAGWVTVNSIASYSARVNYTLTTGNEIRTVYCWYKDAAGNVSSVASDSIILDSTAPLISISSPTTLATHATLEGIVSLSGTASDSASGVLAVEWSSNRGGSGIATGTTNWGIDAVSLLEGENVVTVTARDTAGNSASDTITITYSIPNASTVTTGGSSNVTGSSATISGTVNPDGAETNVWFEVGTSSEWYALSVPAQVIGATAATTTVTVGLTELSEGTTYYYRIVAQNNAGISYGTQKSFTTRDAVAPQGSISINFNAQTTNSRNVILILYATDNVGVRGYYVSLNSTKPLATALGWMNIDQAPEYYAEISYSLSAGEGAKTVYCWYKDGAGNVSSGASNTIIFDTTGPAISITLPTSNTTYSTRSEVVSLQGTARDALSQISSIGWVTSQGGEGFIEVNEDWQIPWVYLPVGENIITVTATDTVGNTNKDTITITYIPPIASTVTTGAYSNVTGSSATISGAVDPGGAETNVWFEVGTISGWYALSVPTQVIGATAATTTVSVELTELARGTTYYYRVVAQNSVGISYGSERSFTAQ
ncbi:MAG: hypothetical protein A2460_03295 [Omnitrophica WOR_2 bacterium RIFOXYC2_FULL_43_9]|nr:MAG: hypothetical protein A2460_03295 [Omnitrophica WOR_2 bacterium RIFOXYC2_FULL_43_9]